MRKRKIVLVEEVRFDVHNQDHYRVENRGQVESAINNAIERFRQLGIGTRNVVAQVRIEVEVPDDLRIKKIKKSDTAEPEKPS